MRITIDLPDDLHEKVAVDALRKPRNSKEAVIAEILRAHYGGGEHEELVQRTLGWRVSKREADAILALRQETKERWK
jgi:hypothetical protein